MKFKQALAALLVVGNLSLVSSALVAQAAQSPVGYTDFANCERIAGWAFDPDTASSPIAIHVYQDGPAGGVFLVAGEATAERPDVNAAYNISGSHGFSIPMPSSAKDGKSHSLYVYGIDNSGDPHAFLNKVEMPPCSTAVNFDAPAPTPVPAPIATRTPTPTPTTIPFDAPTPTPSPITIHAPVGYLEVANCSIIGGWAYDPDTASSLISVHIYKDGPAGTPGAFLLATETTGSRPDVNAAFGITGNHGFTITTPSSLKDGKSHTIYAYGIDSAGGPNPQLNSIHTLPACSVPINFDAPAPTPVPAPIATRTPTPTPTTIPFDAPTPLPVPKTIHAPIGYLDAANCSMIAGWAFDSDTPSSAIAIHIYKDGPSGSGTPIAAETLGLRPDVNVVYDINGTHGFKITTPDSFKDGKSHSVHAYAIDSAGGANTLIGSQTLSCSKPIDPILTNTKIRNTVGYLDVVDCKVIGGWAYDPDHPNDQVSIKIEAIPTVNMADPSLSNKNPGATLAGMTTGSRPDVNAAFGITGNHGFSVITPDSLKNGGKYGFSATAYDLDAPVGSTPIALAGSVFNFSCSAPVTVGPHVDPVATIISIRAKGTVAAGEYARMELRSGNLLLNAWYVTADYANYTTAIPSALSNNIRVYFTNDYFANGEDRNLTVDSVSVSGKTYQSEDIGTFGKGAYVTGQGCVSGFQKGETLHCNNGYFEYPTLAPASVSSLPKTLASFWNIFF